MTIINDNCIMIPCQKINPKINNKAIKKSFLNMYVFNNPNKKWFLKQILGEARKQLTISCVALSLKEFEIWGRANSICFSNTPKNLQQVFPVIVFEKEDLHKYQQVALLKKQTETCFGYVACNIFSMEDFKYATSMISTGKDFVEYLIFRFNILKQLEPCIQLYPLFKKGDQFLLTKNVSTNEQILIS